MKSEKDSDQLFTSKVDSRSHFSWIRRRSNLKSVVIRRFNSEMQLIW